jgi:hypothetical protein
VQIEIFHNIVRVLTHIDQIQQGGTVMDAEAKALADEIGTVFQSAAQFGISYYRPIAQKILSGQITSPNEIEHILDHMLDYCFDDEMLSLYKRLCRHLMCKHPELVYTAVMNYKYVWDSNDEQTASKVGSVNNRVEEQRRSDNE